MATSPNFCMYTPSTLDRTATMLLMPDKTPRPTARTHVDTPGLADRHSQLRDGFEAASTGEDLASSMDDRRDYEELIDTVKSSLWGLLDAPPDGSMAALPTDDQGRVRSAAMEGALALERLKSNLAQAFDAREQLERDIRDAHDALENMRTELAGTQAGERQARHLAAHDPLTGLANRGHFQENLCHALALHALSGHGLAVLYIDLDGFKPINDTYGHAAGDELLCIVANRLSHNVRSGDMVSRLGGDEFACLLHEVQSGEHARRLAIKLLESLRAPCKVGPHMVQVDASIGIAFDTEGAGDPADLLLKADMAMYRAKRERTGIAFYE